MVYLVISGAPAPEGVPALVGLLQAVGWQVIVFSTPFGTRFADVAELERLTGRPVRSEYRAPGTGKPVPSADAVLACPLTFNSVNKFAHGHADNFAVGLLCEMAGYGVPVVVVPHCKPQLASHPAFGASLEALRGMGVQGAVRPGRAVRVQTAAVERGRGRAAGHSRAGGGIMSQDQDTPGARIARARRRRGLSQAVLAGLVGRSESWLSQVERGKRGVDSHAVLTRLAAVLRVDVEELTAPSSGDGEGQQAYELTAQIERAMMRYGAAVTSIGGHQPGSAVNIGHLRAMARSAYQGYQATRYDDTARMLPTLIADAEVVSRAAGLDKPHVCAVRALVYDTAAALLNRVGESALAWTAADRAMAAAEQSGRPALAALAAWRMSYVIGSRRHSAEALELAMTAAAALERTLRTADADALSVPSRRCGLPAPLLPTVYPHGREGDGTGR